MRVDTVQENETRKEVGEIVGASELPSVRRNWLKRAMCGEIRASVREGRSLRKEISPNLVLCGCSILKAEQIRIANFSSLLRGLRFITERPHVLPVSSREHAARRIGSDFPPGVPGIGHHYPDGIEALTGIE